MRRPSFQVDPCQGLAHHGFVAGRENSLFLLLETQGRFANFLRAAISGPGALGARWRRAPEVSDACSYPSCSLEDLVMRTYDINPLWGSTIDFAGFFGLVDGAQHTVGDDSYLPRDVECLSDDRYRISRALADFSMMKSR